MPSRISARVSRKSRFVRPTARRLSPTAIRPPPSSAAKRAELAPEKPRLRAATPVLPEVRLSLARPGDLPALPAFFAAAGGGPAAAELAVQWDAPEALAPRRVLASRGPQVVGHLQFSLLPIAAGPQRVLAAICSHRTILPEHFSRALAAGLLAEAEAKAREAGAAVAILADASWAAGGSWRLLPAERRWTVSAARLLARIEALRRDANQARPSLLVRPWRMVELDALMRIHAARAGNRPGACVRDEERWSWLLTRQAHDRVYLALEGRDRGTFDDINRRVRAYLTLRGQQVVELAGERGWEGALLDLVARACGDALESREGTISYEGAADDPLGTLFGSAGDAAASEPLPRRAILALTREGQAAASSLATLWRPPVWDELECR